MTNTRDLCEHRHTHPNACDDCQQPWCAVCVTYHGGQSAYGCGKRYREALATERAEREATEHRLRNLLARIHRDGGQHAAAVDAGVATTEADQIVTNLFAERDAALVRLAEVEAQAGAMREVLEYAAQAVECLVSNEIAARPAVPALCAELLAAKEEIERLKKDRDCADRIVRAAGMPVPEITPDRAAIRAAIEGLKREHDPDCIGHGACDCPGLGLAAEHNARVSAAVEMVMQALDEVIKL